MLNNDEYDVVHGLLIDWIKLSGDPRGMILAAMRDELQSQLIISRHLNTLVVDAIKICMKSRYTFDPTAMESLLKMLEAAGHVAVSPIIANLRSRPPVSADPFAAEVLGNRLPFANRIRLRNQLREMSLERTHEPILLVRGSAGSGKTHVAELVNHFCFEKENFLCCHVEVEKETGKEVGPLDVARDLVTQFGGQPDESPEVLTNTKKWHGELATWVIAAANANYEKEGERAWLIIDGFNDDELRDDTREFLVQLATVGTKGANARRHRLIYCDFEDHLSATLANMIATYETHPLAEPDIREVVEAIVGSRPGIPEDDKPEVVEQAMALVLKDLSPPLSSLTTIGQRLHDLANQSGGP